MGSEATICKVVGQNVRRAREAMGLSQEELGDVAELDRTYVSGVERGIRNPTIKVLARLADALKIAPSDLLRGSRR
jgi:transcriptional regulator with XRE-family HTH domain